METRQGGLFFTWVTLLALPYIILKIYQQHIAYILIFTLHDDSRNSRLPRAELLINHCLKRPEQDELSLVRIRCWTANCLRLQGQGL
jgi:hypothetical protein